MLKEDVGDLEGMVQIDKGLDEEKIKKLQEALAKFPDTPDDSDEDSTIKSADEFVDFGE
jgi:hypothetical protein